MPAGDAARWPPPAAPGTSGAEPRDGGGAAASPAAAETRLVVYVAGGAAAAAAAAALWWLSRERYYTHFPLAYQYRPGAFSAWAARALARHAKRRRSEFCLCGAFSPMLLSLLLLLLLPPTLRLRPHSYCLTHHPPTTHLAAGRRPIRVYMDGCFDLMHYGHANALRQAKALGDELVVGLVPDSEIRRCKGPPLMDEGERLKMVEGVKWVDEVITGVPYDLTPAFLDELVRRHRVDVVIHGDDPCLLPDGTDAYAAAKRAGRFRMVRECIHLFICLRQVDLI
jgi:cytidyltransferase-like protein